MERAEQEQKQQQHDYQLNIMQKALVNKHSELIKIDHIQIENITKNGENFCSDIYRANVRYQTNAIDNGKNEIKQQSFIMKIIKDELTGLGSSEKLMYETVLPAMTCLLNTPSDGGAVKLNADCLLIDESIDDKESYVLEDLNELGFSMGDRFVGLDLLHAKVLLKKIAQFHAASMVFLEQMPAIFVALQQVPFESDMVDAIADAITLGGMTHVQSIVAEWPDYEEIATKINAKMNKFKAEKSELMKMENCKIKVINHGDLWTNNVLFNYEAAEQLQPRDALFVDFQNCFVGSPAYDINFFLNTSLELNTLRLQRSELMHYYYKWLKRTLLACNATWIPSWELLLEELRKFELIGYYAALCELPICCMSKETSFNFTIETFTNQKLMQEKRHLMYANERVLATLRYVLKRFNEMGVFDD